MAKRAKDNDSGHAALKKNFTIAVYDESSNDVQKERLKEYRSIIGSSVDALEEFVKLDPRQKLENEQYIKIWTDAIKHANAIKHVMNVDAKLGTDTKVKLTNIDTTWITIATKLKPTLKSSVMQYDPKAIESDLNHMEEDMKALEEMCVKRGVALEKAQESQDGKKFDWMDLTSLFAWGDQSSQSASLHGDEMDKEVASKKQAYEVALKDQQNRYRKATIDYNQKSVTADFIKKSNMQDEKSRIEEWVKELEAEIKGKNKLVGELEKNLVEIKTTGTTEKEKLLAKDAELEERKRKFMQDAGKRKSKMQTEKLRRTMEIDAKKVEMTTHMGGFKKQIRYQELGFETELTTTHYYVFFQASAVGEHTDKFGELVAAATVETKTSACFSTFVFGSDSCDQKWARKQVTEPMEHAELKVGCEFEVTGKGEKDLDEAMDKLSNQLLEAWKTRPEERAVVVFFTDGEAAEQLTPKGESICNTIFSNKQVSGVPFDDVAVFVGPDTVESDLKVEEESWGLLSNFSEVTKTMIKGTHVKWSCAQKRILQVSKKLAQSEEKIGTKYDQEHEKQQAQLDVLEKAAAIFVEETTQEVIETVDPANLLAKHEHEIKTLKSEIGRLEKTKEGHQKQAKGVEENMTKIEEEIGFKTADQKRLEALQQEIAREVEPEGYVGGLKVALDQATRLRDQTNGESWATKFGDATKAEAKMLNQIGTKNWVQMMQMKKIVKRAEIMDETIIRRTLEKTAQVEVITSSVKRLIQDLKRMDPGFKMMVTERVSLVESLLDEKWDLELIDGAQRGNVEKILTYMEGIDKERPKFDNNVAPEKQMHYHAFEVIFDCGFDIAGFFEPDFTDDDGSGSDDGKKKDPKVLTSEEFDKKALNHFFTTFIAGRVDQTVAEVCGDRVNLEKELQKDLKDYIGDAEKAETKLEAEKEKKETKFEEKKKKIEDKKEAEEAKDKPKQEKIAAFDKELEDLKSEHDSLIKELDNKFKEKKERVKEVQRLLNSDGPNAKIFKRNLEEQCKAMLKRLYNEVKYSYVKTEEVIRKDVMKTLMASADSKVMQKVKILDLQMEFTEKALEHTLENWTEDQVDKAIQKRMAVSVGSAMLEDGKA